MVIVLRTIHGLAVFSGIVLSGLIVVGVLQTSASMPNALLYVVLYLGILLDELVIARMAWWHFHRCSVAVAATSFAIWLALFVWQGWFAHSPFLRTSESPVSHGTIYPLVVLFVGAHAILPLLCAERANTRAGGEKGAR